MNRDTSIDPVEKAKELDERGRLLMREGKLNESLRCRLEALELFKKNLSATDMTVAECEGDVATTLFALGNYEESLEHRLSSMSGYRANLQPDSPEIIESCIELSSTYIALNDMGSAAKILEDAYEEVRRTSKDPEGTWERRTMTRSTAELMDVLMKASRNP